MAHAVHHQLAHHLDWYAAGECLPHKGTQPAIPRKASSARMLKSRIPDSRPALRHPISDLAVGGG
jgi:hypothetical protein